MRQVVEKILVFLFFSIQLDEFTDVAQCPQLLSGKSRFVCRRGGLKYIYLRMSAEKKKPYKLVHVR